MRKSTYLALAFGGLMLSAGVLAADDKPADGKIEPAAVDLGRPIDFTKDVQPILDDKCVACHNVAIAESRLILEDAPSIMKGGKRGPSVVPKDPEKSLLYILAARGQQPAMPPLPNKASAEAVTPQELGILKQWILEGAQGGMGSSGPAVAFQAVPESLHAIYSIALSPWSRYAVCSRANQIDVYDVVTGEYVQRLVDPALSTLTSKDQPMYPHGAAHQDFVHALAYSPTADLIASAGYREVKLWQRGQNVQLKKFAIENVPTATAVSPDGKLLAAAMPDHAIRLISLADGAPQKSLAGHTLPVTSLQFTADGSKLYSASNDKSVRVWNIADGAQVDVLETPAEVLSFAWNADGKLLLTGHQDNLIRSWNIPFDKPGAEPVKSVRDYAGSGGPVTALTLVAPGAHFLSAGADGHWREWDLASGAAVRAINHGAPVTSLSVRNDGKLVATAGANVGKLWSIEGQPVGEIKGNLAAQRKVVVMTEDDAVAKAHVALADASFKAAEKNLTERTEAVKKANEQKEAADKALAEAKTKEEAAVAARDEAQKKLEGDANNDGLKKTKEEADKALTAAQEATKKAQEAVDAAVKTIAQTTKAQQTADEQQKAAKTVLDNETTLGKQAEERLNAAKAELPATEKPLFQLAFSPDGKFLAATGEDGVVRLYDGKTARPLEELVNQPAAPTRVLLFGVDRALISIADDKQVIVWDSNPPFQLVGVLGPKPEAPLDVAPSPFISRVLSLAFSPDGKLLAAGGGDPSRSGELSLWNVESKSFLKAFPDAHSDTVFSLDFSRDGKLLASGAADKFVKVHDVESGKLVRSFEGHTHHVLGVSFKADGSRVASAGADNAIKVWNMETGEQFRTIANYSKQVTGIHYIGVGDNLLSCSGDKAVKMHRSNDGNNYRSLSGSTDYMYAVAVNRDETLALAGGEDGILRVWNAQNGQELFKFEPPKPAAKPNTQASAK